MILNAPITSNVPIKSIYLLYGSDIWQLLNGLTNIKNNFPETKRYYFLNFKQFVQFYNNNQEELFNRDLFCVAQFNKIIEIYIQDAKFSKAQSIELEKFLNKVLNTKNICVILFAEKYSKDLEKSKLFQLVNKEGLIIVSKNLSISQCKLWLTAELKLLNLSFTNDALNKFIKIYQHNLLQAKQILVKLELNYIHAKNLVNPIIIDLVNLEKYLDEYDLKYTLFDLQDSLTTASLAEIIKIFINLKQQQVEPILILWSIIQAIKKFMQKSLIIHDKMNNNKIIENNYIKYSNLLSKTTKIDLMIKCVDNKPSNIDHKEYIWGSLIDLCMAFVK